MRRNSPLRLLAGLLVAWLLCAALLPGLFPHARRAEIDVALQLLSRDAPQEHAAHRGKAYDLRRGAVLLVLDDGWASQYTAAWPILSTHGIPATVTVVSGLVGTPGYMDTSQLLTLYRAGWDMANHTATHTALAGHTARRQRAEMDACRRWLKRYHLYGAEDLLVFPYGAYDDSSFAALSAGGYHAARSLTDYRCLSPPLTVPGVVIESVTPSLPQYTLEQLLDTAVRERGILILILHRITDEPNPYGMNLSASRLEQLCSALAQRHGLQCITLSQLQEGLEDTLFQSDRTP